MVSVSMPMPVSAGGCITMPMPVSVGGCTMESMEAAGGVLPGIIGPKSGPGVFGPVAMLGSSEQPDTASPSPSRATHD